MFDMTAKEWFDLVAGLVPVIVGILGVVYGYIQKRRERFPARVEEWLGIHNIDQSALKNRTRVLVQEAETFYQKSSVERQAWVVDKLQVWIQTKYSLPVPKSIINTIIEVVIQWARKR